ncbi:MAG TPA: PilZ domain-containing protein [bacterium]|nr:PilZ domain-containing protein [bacterium]
MNKTPSSSPERRKYPRVKFQESVVVHNVVESKSGNVFEVQGNPMVVKAQDVSEGGIRLEVGDGNPLGKIFKLNFQIQKGRSVDIYSRLAWAAEGMFGLQFIVADEEIRRNIRGLVEKSK